MVGSQSAAVRANQVGKKFRALIVGKIVREATVWSKENGGRGRIRPALGSATRSNFGKFNHRMEWLWLTEPRSSSNPCHHRNGTRLDKWGPAKYRLNNENIHRLDSGHHPRCQRG
jgi:hypothetical protein